jgi:hypothetical protein
MHGAKVKKNTELYPFCVVVLSSADGLLFLAEIYKTSIFYEYNDLLTDCSAHSHIQTFCQMIKKIKNRKAAD